MESAPHVAGFMRAALAGRAESESQRCAHWVVRVTAAPRKYRVPRPHRLTQVSQGICCAHIYKPHIPQSAPS